MASVPYLITSLATFAGTVTGITDSFDISAIPEKVSDTQLPCAFIVPEVGTEQGLKLISMMGNSPALTIELSQVILVSAASGSEPWRDLPTVLALLDNYNNAAKTQKFLDSQAGPPYNQVVINYSVAIGITEWGGVEYHSLSMRHQYTLYL